MQRELAGRPFKVSVQYEDIDGNAVVAPAAMTVTVRDGAGVEVVAATPADDDGDGRYVFTVPARQQLDRLELLWQTTNWQETNYVDIVGARLFSLTKMRTVHELQALGVEELRRLRDDVEVRFSDILGFPVVPVGLRTSVLGGGPRLLASDVLLPLSLYSASEDGAVLDLAVLRLRTGWIERTDGGAWPFAKTITLHLAHGMADPPSDLREAGLRYARYLARQPDKKIPDRATRVTTEGADFSLSGVDHDHPTGYPDVDEVLVRRRIELPV